MFAPCGMNCLVCYKHCYHKKPCAGCLNSDMGKPEHCRKCKIKDCIKGREQPLRPMSKGTPGNPVGSRRTGFQNRHQTRIFLLKPFHPQSIERNRKI